MQDWQGKVVLVTGASSGLGRTIATAFAARHARVVIAARGADDLQKTADELRAAGYDATAIAADVTRQESVDALLAGVIEQFGQLDALVNNAGRSARGAILDTTPDDFRDLLDINLLGVVRLTRAAAPHLLRSGGHLINISSLAGKSASRFLGAYPASKFAVTAYTQQLRLELEPQGLHVLLVCPGPIEREAPRRHALETAGAEALPAEAYKPGGGVKVSLISPEKLAERILRACERRDPEIVTPGKARILFAISQLSPRLGDWLVRRMTS
jgi:NAD(P)-dependent dehydrogenase (short-subunit alcohol dehydrogenase family)